MDDNDMKLFDWKFYTEKYDDLKQAGINTCAKAKRHWERFGKQENRCCFKPKTEELEEPRFSSLEQPKEPIDVHTWVQPPDSEAVLELEPVVESVEIVVETVEIVAEPVSEPVIETVEIVVESTEAVVETVEIVIESTEAIVETVEIIESVSVEPVAEPTEPVESTEPDNLADESVEIDESVSVESVDEQEIQGGEEPKPKRNSRKKKVIIEHEISI